MENDNDHIRKQIEQLLFTHPGERVDQPDFGIGLQQYLFEANTEPLRTRIQQTVQQALKQWLGEVIDVEEMEVTLDASSMGVLGNVCSVRVHNDQGRMHGTTCKRT